MPVSAVVAIVVALLALVGVILSLRQKNATDRRNAWWDRVEWALNALRGDEEERRLAIALLNRLAFEKGVDQRDRNLIESVILVVLGQ